MDLAAQIKDLISQLESGARSAGQVNEWYATHRPVDLIDDIQEGRVTFLDTALVRPRRQVKGGERKDAGLRESRAQGKAGLKRKLDAKEAGFDRLWIIHVCVPCGKVASRGGTS